MTLKQSNSPYGYKNLLVYKKAEELQSACASFTSYFPPFSHSSRSKTLSALADQMDRSARSVKQNIVEGWKRNSTKEYHEFLGFSLGANAELEEDCNDIIKGVYAEMGLKGLGKWDKGEEGEERGAPSSHFPPFSLSAVERLPFYPLDTRLPLSVQLKLRCKELNMLLDKLQRSLVDKMSADHTLGQREMQSLALGREAANDAWIQKEREKLEKGDEGGDGKRGKEEKGNQRGKGDRKGERGAVKVSLATVGALLILSLPFIFRPFAVTGGSMEPTYSEGTVVIAEKLTHRFYVSRGEVLVIRNPHQKEVIEIKRVIGLPNETIETGESGVTVTDEKGKSTKYETGSTIGGEYNGTFRIKLGPEDYLVLGDNRSKSSDSRSFGAVQKSDIIGHVMVKL